MRHSQSLRNLRNEWHRWQQQSSGSSSSSAREVAAPPALSIISEVALDPHDWSLGHHRAGKNINNSGSFSRLKQMLLHSLLLPIMNGQCILLSCSSSSSYRESAPPHTHLPFPFSWHSVVTNHKQGYSTPPCSHLTSLPLHSSMRENTSAALPLSLMDILFNSSSVVQLCCYYPLFIVRLLFSFQMRLIHFCSAWLLLVFIPRGCHGGNILVFPGEGSHWLNMDILLEALHSRGHNITVVRPSKSWYIKDESSYYNTYTVQVERSIDQEWVKKNHI
ncbi:hypothetical protein F7725_026029 [Dissostichus mawsoni]|uniref:Uncharacterized protein n=1 Tax=Dissostichus mawsoni TaxID=36200 RepID=A0A7J5X5W7_DISMA|nr:hypothetical protein F7725_026029 [Dissostichus mawsoni]